MRFLLLRVRFLLLRVGFLLLRVRFLLLRVRPGLPLTRRELSLPGVRFLLPGPGLARRYLLPGVSGQGSLPEATLPQGAPRLFLAGLFFLVRLLPWSVLPRWSRVITQGTPGWRRGYRAGCGRLELVVPGPIPHYYGAL
ncbi:hypothetical protein AU468_11445 [Alkalispirochaeta sphaeroplastigenens]|uniref:Uncharacterized protein n=1 Tax=Alkalispirochaeta sphaeroplastigenens TaxID=1187066 RepID=A0A2S4JHI3_9SPIO|nr:hypothetical protein AU468_11445 [Alkalispirochaeta sphaeroplastigenens]